MDFASTVCAVNPPAKNTPAATSLETAFASNFILLFLSQACDLLKLIEQCTNIPFEKSKRTMDWERERILKMCCRIIGFIGALFFVNRFVRRAAVEYRKRYLKFASDRAAKIEHENFVARLQKHNSAGPVTCL